MSPANELLNLPGFVLKVSSQDWHPKNHISFATNHATPNDKPIESFVEMKNPVQKKGRGKGKGDATRKQQLFPMHCVQNSAGAALVPELAAHKIDLRVLKGMNTHVEMYSAFADAFGNTNCVDTGAVNLNLEPMLKQHGVSHVYVVGLAGEYCVKCTAVDAAKAGFKTYVVEEGVRSVDPGEGWSKAVAEMREHRVELVRMHGPEVARLAA